MAGTSLKWLSKVWYPKKRKMTKYKCSDGTEMTQRQIDLKRSWAYRYKYESNPHPRCEETGERAQCSSHIISQKRCKELHKTELIWDADNFYPATYEANSRWESNDRTLKNYDKYMKFVQKHDPEGYLKRVLFNKA